MVMRRSAQVSLHAAYLCDETGTYCDVQEKPPPAAAEEVAEKLEGLGVVVGVTAPGDVDENVVEAGPAPWVDDGFGEVGVLDGLAN